MEAQLNWRRLMARLLIATTASLQIPQEPHATPISTESAVRTDRERVLVLLERPDLRAQLEAYGVQPADARARVAAMTDAEVAQLAAGIEDAPAGGFIQAIAYAAVGLGYAVIYGVALVVMAVAALAKIARS